MNKRKKIIIYFKKVNLPKNKTKKLNIFLQPKVLLGTRNGDILEATITYDGSIRMKSKSASSNYLKNAVNNIMDQKEDEDLSDGVEEDDYASTRFKSSKGLNRITTVSKPPASEKPSFKLSNYLRFHCSQFMNPQVQNNFFNKKVYIALHPSIPIMVSVAEDQNLFVWSTEKNKLLQVTALPYIPTAVKFTPEKGEILVIGFINGALLFLDSNYSKNPLGKVGESKYLNHKLKYSTVL